MVAERRTLPRGVVFWVAAAIALVASAANTAASPLYRVYQAEFRFSAATTLTALFAAYILVLLATRTATNQRHTSRRQEGRDGYARSAGLR